MPDKKREDKPIKDTENTGSGGFLDNSGDIILDADLTAEGRQRLAREDTEVSRRKFDLKDEETNMSSMEKARNMPIKGDEYASKKQEVKSKEEEIDAQKHSAPSADLDVVRETDVPSLGSEDDDFEDADWDDDPEMEVDIDIDDEDEEMER